MMIHDTFAGGSMVMNIHEQLFQLKDVGPREDWYIGVFHLVDGKVREWNDYAIVPVLGSAGEAAAWLRPISSPASLSRWTTHSGWPPLKLTAS